jgi:peptide/nickel transport system ATP-binding protein
LLTTQNLSFSYNKRGTRPALRRGDLWSPAKTDIAHDAPLFANLNLEFAATERVALQAPSGFGKTTLCKLLAGYLQPTNGAVLLDGEPLPKSRVCPVQMIWQHPEQAVDPRMRMTDALAQAGTVAPALIERLGIRADWLTRYPHELSGGELQRFCIARALATQPRYLIADEITTMLDAVTQAQIWQVIFQEVQAQKIGLILITHSPTLTPRLATRTVELHTSLCT